MYTYSFENIYSKISEHMINESSSVNYLCSVKEDHLRVILEKYCEIICCNSEIHRLCNAAKLG